MLDIVQHLVRNLFLVNVRHTIKYGIAKGLKRIGGITFLPLRHQLTKENKFLIAQVYKNKIVYDIGTYEGLLTIFFANRVGPMGKVIFFEPNPVNYHITKRNVLVNKFEHVIGYKYAIGEKEYTIDLKVPKYFRGHGTLLDKTCSNSKNYPVQVFSIDYLLEQNILPPPDFIKIDIEGFELFALNGMKLLLEKRKPKLFIEVHDFIENNMFDIIDFLKKYNYSVYHVEQNISDKDIKHLNIKYGHIFCE